MIDVVMPQMGESIVEGTLTKWLKKKGDHVERDEPLFEISTDKVDTEIPSPSAGTLSEIMVEEGKTVGINTVVGRISEGANGAGAPAAAPQPAAQPTSQPTAQTAAPPPLPPQATQPATPQAAQPATPTAPPPQASEPEAPVATVVEETAGPLSPLVRKMARENNIDLSKVKGTGAGGRITKQDLESFLSAHRRSLRQLPQLRAAGWFTTGASLRRRRTACVPTAQWWFPHTALAAASAPPVDVPAAGARD